MDVRKGQWWRELSGAEFRVMSVAENYAMCRRKGCLPFVKRVNTFNDCKKLAIPAKDTP